MSSVAKLVVQAIAYIAFAVFLGYLSASPGYDYGRADMATVKLSLNHAANRVKPCVRLTPQEMAELPPNMRVPEKCERERLPLSVELEIDGETLVSVLAPPSGLWNDGAASVYERFDVEPGQHTVTARLRDTNRSEGWDYVYTETVNLAAGRYFTVTFRPETGGFSFR